MGRRPFPEPGVDQILRRPASIPIVSFRVISGVIMLFAIACASVGAFLIYIPAGWITIAAGLAYVSWAAGDTREPR